MRKESHFNPPWWLANRHLQTFWAPLTQRVSLPKLQRERVELRDGDFLDLDWVNPDRDAPTVILLHGLEGNIESPYLRRMLFKIHQKRWRGVLVYWRGCSGEMNRLDKTYHAGRSDDLAEVVQYIYQQKNPKQLFASGYSLGGNVLLKWLGEQGVKANIDAGCAVSAPFDLKICSDSIDKGFSKIYKHYLLASLKKKMLQKFNQQELLEKLNLTPRDVRLIASFREFDNRITARLNDFKAADDYYAQASSIGYLHTITRPTLIIHAQDDPFMSADVIPDEDELAENIELQVSERGGHVGFVSQPNVKTTDFSLENKILDYFSRIIDQQETV